ncbi:hypothetical protein HETIRDRAFT_436050 [Heterobasidion irregulare TC 32-1]|uniref:Uncharacterized protein n=1 Tax=Heterobasidion irregulare (strain TC 32-1) TaxID=747525 RepID=W4JY18_HETIT|nr:uncharacterized protein HETIRDRAFT_436050 [Heterobasidion irregulare TC 32-1]ETW78339.1 hypothetical protein HETIRDRAFT_436050 [Heterobasidion irregulare TC 32-1]
MSWISDDFPLLDVAILAAARRVHPYCRCRLCPIRLQGSRVSPSTSIPYPHMASAVSTDLTLNPSHATDFAGCWRPLPLVAPLLDDFFFPTPLPKFFDSTARIAASVTQITDCRRNFLSTTKISRLSSIICTNNRLLHGRFIARIPDSAAQLLDSTGTTHRLFVQRIYRTTTKLSDSSYEYLSTQLAQRLVPIVLELAYCTSSRLSCEPLRLPACFLFAVAYAFYVLSARFPPRCATAISRAFDIAVHRAFHLVSALLSFPIRDTFRRAVHLLSPTPLRCIPHLHFIARYTWHCSLPPPLALLIDHLFLTRLGHFVQAAV